MFDSRNEPIAGASIHVVNQATGVERRCATDYEGMYRVPFLLPAKYQVFVQAPGFSTASSPELSLSAGQLLTYDVQLKVGAISQTVLVQGLPPLLQSGDASIGQVVSMQTIESTPLSGRNWVYLAQLTAGVVPPEGSRGNGKGDFNADGQRTEQNNFLIDGVDNNTMVVDFLNGSSFVVRPPPDALAEFRIQTANYSAEYGHSAGAVVSAVMKSGTNEVHGSAWEYIRNNALDARDWDASTVPGYRENQFGASLGLPLVRNKLFFFGDTEANRIFFQEMNFLTVPTTLMRIGNFTELLNGSFNGTGAPLRLTEPGNPSAVMGSSCGNPVNTMCAAQIDPAAQHILSLYPQSNVETSSGFANNYLVARNSTDNTFQFDLRVDGSLSPRDQAFVRLSQFHEPGNRAAPLGAVLDGGNFLTFGDDGIIGNRGGNLAANATHIFSDRFANEFRIGYTWGHFAYTQENAENTALAASLGLGGIPGGAGNGGLPTVNIGGISGFGSPEFYATGEDQNVLNLLDDAQRNYGSHSLKFGVSLQRIRFTTHQPPVPRGEYDYESSAASCADTITYTGYGLADFLSNAMGCAELSSIANTDDLRWDREVYLQDDWRVTPRLTLNLGVRYQYPQTYRELNGRQAEWFVDGPLAVGNTPSIFRLPVQDAETAPGNALAQLLASSGALLQYSTNPYLIHQARVNFAPRLGLSVLLSDKSVLRAGYGVFYGALESIGYSGNLGNNPPFVNQYSFFANAPNGCVTGNCPTDGITLESGFGPALGVGGSSSISETSLRGMDPEAHDAYTEDYNLAFGFSIRRDTAAVLAYVGSESHHLTVFTNPNAPLALQPTGAVQTSQQPLPAFGSSIFSSQIGHSSYNSLQVTLERRPESGLGFLATYTFSHAIDDAPTPLGSNGDDGFPNTNIQPPGAQTSNSPFDVRHRFTLNGSYTFPSPSAGHGFFSRPTTLTLLSQWSVSASFAAQTGNPFSVTPDFSTFHIASGARVVYATRIADPFRAGGSPPASNPFIECAQTVRNKQHWYNPCAFGNPLPGTTIPVGGAVAGPAAQAFLGGRRNNIYGPGYERVNLSLFKIFPLRRLGALEIRTDVFNLFNTPSYANPNGNSSGGGLQSGVPTNSSAGGQITSPRFFQNFTPDARFLQFSLKYQF